MKHALKSSEMTWHDTFPDLTGFRRHSVLSTFEKVEDFSESIPTSKDPGN